MQDRYNHAEVEKAAQDQWESTHAYKTTENDPRFPKGKFYACSMLPYPSGRLHMGHVRNYTINDVSSLVSPLGDPADGTLRVRSVIVNDLSTMRKSGHTWLNDLSKLITVW